MIQQMLAQLDHLTGQTIALQQQGNYPAALGSYELALEALSYYEEIGRHRDVGEIHRRMLAAQETPARALHLHALILLKRQHPKCAAEAVKAALLVAPDDPFLHILHGKISTTLGDLHGAVAAYENARRLMPNLGGAHDGAFMIASEQEMPGEDYYYWLQRFHQWLKPASYVEIGLGHGRSLALAGPETRAVGIDPFMGFWERLHYVSPHTPAALFPLTSDDFFARHDLKGVLGRETFDLAFIDGLHIFEQALKDFINLERYAGKDSVILIHDCLPVAPIVAERERCTGFWTGDVWRILPCLKTFRPDLNVFTIPTKPSGLAVVTGLDPGSTVLRDNFDKIVTYYLGLHLPESMSERFMLLNVEPLDEKAVAQRIGVPDNRRQHPAADTAQKPFSPNRRASRISSLSIDGISQIAAHEVTTEEQAVFDYLKNVHCLTNTNETLAIFRLCKLLPDNARILEIGSYQGASAIAIGKAIRGTACELYCIDPWSNFVDQDDFINFDHSQIADDMVVMENFIRNTSFIGENIRMLRGKSSSFAGLLEGKDFDFIFIDGAHDYASVRNDIKIAFSALKPGGFVCGHDFHSAGKDVVRAVTELVAIPSIPVRGVIKDTFIWFAVVEDPCFEYKMVEISDLCNAGRLKEALDKAYAVNDKYDNEQTRTYISAIQSALATSPTT